MAQAPRYRNPHGGTAPRTASPVRPGFGPKGASASPVRVVDGFTTALPGRTLRFFQRQFFAPYPRPIQTGGAAPFPRRVPIARIELPRQQSLVLRYVEFQAYQHSGIGIEDLALVPEGRAVGTLGFEFTIGNQGLTDFLTNLPGRGVPVNYGPAQGGVASAPRAGEGVTFQGTGVVTPNVLTNEKNYAGYGMPGQAVVANALVLRPPSYDLRLFKVTFSGWLVEQKNLEKILDSLSQ